MLKSFFDKIYEEALFSILVVLLLAMLPYRIPSSAAIDWKVIAALWNLMLIAVALEELNFLDWLASGICSRFHTERSLALALIFTTMGLSMFVTNDVALLTVVPITLTIGRKGGFDPLVLVVLETIAANVGSSLTPFGNPQNIFLFNYYRYTGWEFVKVAFPFVGAASAGLLAIAGRRGTGRLSFETDAVLIGSKPKLGVYLILFGLAVLSVLHVLPWQWVTALITVTVLLLDRRHLLQVDYFLLATFALFFLLIDGIGSLDALKELMAVMTAEPLRVLWSAGLLSQVISNVPAGIVMAPFVTTPGALVQGVSLGGMGTLIASLANLIAYKIYARDYPGGPYLRYFTKINCALFAAVALFLSLLHR